LSHFDDQRFFEEWCNIGKERLKFAYLGAGTAGMDCIRRDAVINPINDGPIITKNIKATLPQAESGIVGTQPTTSQHLTKSKFVGYYW
jgi:hypothetical protein